LDQLDQQALLEQKVIADTMAQKVLLGLLARPAQKATQVQKVMLALADMMAQKVPLD
jgi:hypothetical protein